MPAFDLTRFHSLLRTRELGRNLIFEPVVRSTMDLARDAIAHGAVEGTLALADEQTAGRGRLGRSWVAPPGANLLSTLVLYPPAGVMRRIAMLTPLAIVDAARAVAKVDAAIKWPNDVLLEGKKLAGVLIESGTTDDGRGFALVGAGINVNFDPRAVYEIRDIATSLAAVTGRDVDRATLLASYLLHFEQVYDAARAGTSPRDRWRSLLVTLGKRVTATEQRGVTEGIAEDVDEDGSLLVRVENGSLVTVEAGDVTLRV